MNERRRFLTKAGKVVLATPPALAMLISTKGRAYAGATSGRYSGGGEGWGGGGGGTSVVRRGFTIIAKFLGWLFGRWG
jgi:hypothetical protein